MSTTITDKRII